MKGKRDPSVPYIWLNPHHSHQVGPTICKESGFNTVRSKINEDVKQVFHICIVAVMGSLSFAGPVHNFPSLTKLPSMNYQLPVGRG